MKMTFGSRTCRQDSDVVETITATYSRYQNWAGTVGKPCRYDAPVRLVDGVYVRGDRRWFRVSGHAPHNRVDLARVLFKAAGITEGEWTWTITSTRQEFRARRTA